MTPNTYLKSYAAHSYEDKDAETTATTSTAPDPRTNPASYTSLHQTNMPTPTFPTTRKQEHPTQNHQPDNHVTSGYASTQPQ